MKILLPSLALAVILVIFNSCASRSASAKFAISAPLLQEIEKEYGYAAKRRALSLVDMMNQVRDMDEIHKLEKVNAFFNRSAYVSDSKVWGTSDYWATRLEFIAKDRGDCEDFTVAKYFTLKDLEIPASKLFITYAQSLRYHRPHLMLTYYTAPGAVPLVLDNCDDTILLSSQRPDLVPIYSINGADFFGADRLKIIRLFPALRDQARSWDELEIMRIEE